MKLRRAVSIVLPALAILVCIVACASAGQPTLVSPAASTAASLPQAARPTCDLPPILAPTAPLEVPRYVELDPATNLHMTGTPPQEPVDIASYRLKISGKVTNPVELAYDEIRCLPKVQAAPLLVCPGFFEDQATWGGTPVKEVLALAGVQQDATAVKFLAASDKYRVVLSLDEALDEQNLLAYEWEGQPLPRYHGFPFRLVLPGVEGNQWIKWITEIVVE